MKLVLPFAMVAILAVSDASAATLTMTAGATTRTYTVSAASLARVQAYVNAQYALLPDGSPNPSPLGSMFDAIFQGIVNNVKNFESGTAHAAVPVPPDLN